MALRLGLAALEEGRRDQQAAIERGGDAHHRLQRRHRQAVAEGDGDGVDLAPALGNQRLGAFRQFGAQAVELAHLFQERLVLLDAERQRHARGADVGGIGEDLRHREEAVLRLVVVDGEAAVMQRMARIEARAQRHLAGVERHRHRQHLEGRAHLVDAGGQPVDAGRIVGLARIVRIVVGLRHQRDDLAGIDVEDDAGRGLGLELLARLDEFVAQRELHAQIERELDRPLQPVGGKPRHVQRGEPLPVQPFLDAGDALVVDIDVADRGARPSGRWDRRACSR